MVAGRDDVVDEGVEADEVVELCDVALVVLVLVVVEL